MPVVAFFWLIHHDGVNAIWYDQWDDINVIAHPTLSVLWTQHNEDRIFFPNLLVLALAHTIHFNIHIEDYLSGIMLVVAAGLFIVTHKRRSLSTVWLYYCPVAFIMLSLVQFGNALWGFQIAWYLVMLALAGALFLLDRPMLNWSVLMAAIGVAVVGSFSSLQGLLIWPAGLVLLYSRRRPKGLVITWFVAGIVSGVVYFYHYSSSSADAGSSSSYMFSHPLIALEFYLSAVGDIVGQQLSPTGLNHGVIVLGATIFAVAVWILIAYGFRRDESGTPIGIALICVGLLFAVIITAGRAAYGPFYADASRYTTFDLLILVGCYLAMLDGRDRGRKVAHSIRTGYQGNATSEKESLDLQVAKTAAGTSTWHSKSLAITRVIITLTVVVLVVLGTRNGLAQASVWRQKLMTAAAVEVNIEKASDNVVAGTLYPNPSPKTALVRKLAQIAKDRDLSVFATSSAAQYSIEGLPRESSPVTKMSTPANGAILRGATWLGASGTATIGSVKVNVDKVEFEVTGGDLKRAIIGTAGYTYLGWVDLWNTASIPNGMYRIQSIASNSAGKTTYSDAVPVEVENRPG